MALEHDCRPVAVVGHINIPDSVLKHRFVIEVEEVLKHKFEVSTSKKDRVIGTANNYKVELYAWGKNVTSHVDESGFVYFLLLNEGMTEISTPECSVMAKQGDVVRLNDRIRHSTRDNCMRIAAFVGSYTMPHDEQAITLFEQGVERLAAGEYYDTPRVAKDYRIPGEDECYATAAFDTADLVQLSDVASKGLYIELCTVCRKPAQYLDRCWPYHTDRSLCRACFQ